MTIVIANIPSSGVTLDDQSARVDVFHASDTQIVTHQTVGVTDKWLEFRSDLIGNRALAAIGQDVVPWTFANAVMVISGYLWIDQDPTNTKGLPILSEASAANYMYARIGYGAGNTKVGATDWQKNLIAQSVSEVTHVTDTGFAIAYDWANYTTVHVRIYMNDGSGWVQEAHIDSGLSRASFFNAAAGVGLWGETSSVGRGAKWRGVHLTLSYSLTAADAPHLSPWPIYMSGGMVAPKAQGFYDEWSAASSTHAIGSGLRWQDVGLTHDMASPGSHPLPGNDGDTTRVGSTTADQRQTFINATDAHPISTVTSPTIDNVRLPVVQRTGAGKVAANPIIRLGGSDVTINSWSATTTYTGIESTDLNRPGGGSWAVADFAPGAGLEWGARAFSTSEASGASIAANLTSAPGPIPTYHVETLPTGEPGAVGLEVPRQVAGAKAPVIRPQFDHLAELRATGGVLRQMRETEETLRRIIRARRRDPGRCGRSGSVLVRR